MSCTDGRLAPARSEIKYTVMDGVRGNVRFEIYDRACIDDLTIHLIRRELYRLAGGADPGNDVNQGLKDFLIRDNYLEIR